MMARQLMTHAVNAEVEKIPMMVLKVMMIAGMPGGGTKQATQVVTAIGSLMHLAPVAETLDTVRCGECLLTKLAAHAGNLTTT